MGKQGYNPRRVNFFGAQQQHHIKFYAAALRKNYPQDAVH
jgi:hypothetical protein